MIKFHNFFITNCIFEDLINQVCFSFPLGALNVKMKVDEKIIFKREEEEEETKEKEEKQEVEKTYREFELRHGIWAWKLIQHIPEIGEYPDYSSVGEITGLRTVEVSNKPAGFIF